MKDMMNGIYGADSLIQQSVKADTGPRPWEQELVASIKQPGRQKMSDDPPKFRNLEESLAYLKGRLEDQQVDNDSTGSPAEGDQSTNIPMEPLLRTQDKEEKKAPSVTWDSLDVVPQTLGRDVDSDQSSSSLVESLLQTQARREEEDKESEENTYILVDDSLETEGKRKGEDTETQGNKRLKEDVELEAEIACKFK